MPLIGSCLRVGSNPPRPLALSSRRLAGAAIFVGAVQFGIGVILAEIYYPNYNVSANYISDLGATCKLTCQVFQPTATIFDASVALLGLLVLFGAYSLNQAFHSKLFTGLLALAGIGALGVGLFPETTGAVHGIFSLIAFLFAGLSAVRAVSFQKPPMSYFSVILGIFTLVALFLYTGSVYLGLGAGGMERMIVYPALLWAIGFGGYMMSPDTGR